MENKLFVNKKDLPWWKKAIIYQIYPLSYKDDNGDGYGDIKGIISKLDYLKQLNVDAIWLSPIYVSDMNDNGYDVIDYYNIDPLFGTMDDFDELMMQASKRNIKIIMDLVCNHTSIHHQWFQQAISSKNNKYQKYYFFKEKNDDKESSFGGSAWKYVKSIDKYYYHYFDESQADLNWQNDELKDEICKIINFWLKKGVGGFRLDAIELISKDLEKNIFANGPFIHEYLNYLYENSFSKNKECMTVGEGWPTVEIALDYTASKKKQIDMIFQFETITLDWSKDFGRYKVEAIDYTKFKDSIANWQISLCNIGWNALFLENHDLGRIVSRYGNDNKYLVESAKQFAITMMFLKGTIFLYQGQEIGMTNPKFEKKSDYKDADFINHYQSFVLEKKLLTKEQFIEGAKINSRDNCRTPMQWDDSINGGFSTSNKTWIKVNPNYPKINVKIEEEDCNSVLHFYKKLIMLRKEVYQDIILLGNFEYFMNDDPYLFIYKRTYEGNELVIINNYSNEEKPYGYSGFLKLGFTIIVNNHTTIKENCLLAYQSIVMYKGE